MMVFFEYCVTSNYVLYAVINSLPLPVLIKLQNFVQKSVRTKIIEHTGRMATEVFRLQKLVSSAEKILKFVAVLQTSKIIVA